MFRRGIIISMIALINFAIAAEVTLNPIQLTSIKQDGGSDYQVSNNHIGSDLPPYVRQFDVLV